MKLVDVMKAGGKGYNPYRGAGGRFTSGAGGSAKANDKLVVERAKNRARANAADPQGKSITRELARREARMSPDGGSKRQSAEVSKVESGLKRLESAAVKFAKLDGIRSPELDGIIADVKGHLDNAKFARKHPRAAAKQGWDYEDAISEAQSNLRYALGWIKDAR